MKYEEWVKLVRPPEELDEVEAKRVYRNFGKRLTRLQIKARHGNHEAAHKIITVLTEQEVALHELGYRTLDEGGIGPITQEWIDRMEASKTKMDRLTEKAREGDMDAARQVILLMAEQGKEP